MEGLFKLIANSISHLPNRFEFTRITAAIINEHNIIITISSASGFSMDL